MAAQVALTRPPRFGMGGLRNERQQTFSLETSWSHESTSTFDFAVTNIGRVVRAPAADHHRFWLHDFCGFAWRAETRSYVARWTRTSLDARAFVAGIPGAAIDFVSRWTSLWRNADARLDVAADRHGSERRIRRGVAKLFAANDS